MRFFQSLKQNYRGVLGVCIPLGITYGGYSEVIRRNKRKNEYLHHMFKTYDINLKNDYKQMYDFRNHSLQDFQKLIKVEQKFCDEVKNGSFVIWNYGIHPIEIDEKIIDLFFKMIDKKELDESIVVNRELYVQYEKNCE